MWRWKRRGSRQSRSRSGWPIVVFVRRITDNSSLTRTQAGGRLVQHVEDAKQPGAQLAGHAEALELTR
jgi:hypothetical protein